MSRHSKEYGQPSDQHASKPRRGSIWPRMSVMHYNSMFNTRSQVTTGTYRSYPSTGCALSLRCKSVSDAEAGFTHSGYRLWHVWTLVPPPPIPRVHPRFAQISCVWSSLSLVCLGNFRALVPQILAMRMLQYYAPTRRQSMALVRAREHRSSYYARFFTDNHQEKFIGRRFSLDRSDTRIGGQCGSRSRLVSDHGKWYFQQGCCPNGTSS
ncbi:hypothetical protein FKP32DRAFT_149910 [Trametes sanguinea]|nr:hypothetical protein FKP32DRAFT_149910 [Trametes sanguinea]